MGVTEREIVLEFSERLSGQSARAITVVPESETPPEVQVRGGDIRITLDSLREATTYVVTVSTDLRDARGVALRQPLTLAFSTGDVLDRGRITGRVLTPERGEPAAGRAVWAYRADSTSTLPDPRSQPPDYGTQSGPDGAFALEYLREGTYFVVAVEDANRNRRADPGERFAAPPRPLLPADTLARDPLALYVARRDTTAPEIRSVRALSDRRFHVRFSEPVVSRDPSALTIRDSAGVSVSGVPQLGRLTAYEDPEDPASLIAWAREPVRPGPARIHATSVYDSTGNDTWTESPVFTVPAQADTLRTRFVRFEPAPPAPDSAARLRPRPGLPPVPPRVILSGPSDELVTVIASHGATSDTSLVTGTVLTPMLSVPAAGRQFIPMSPTRIVVETADTTVSARFEPYPDRELGALTGRVVADGGRMVYVQAVPASGAPVQTFVDDGAFAFERLLPGEYRLRFVVFREPRDPFMGFRTTGNRPLWDGGSLAPYLPPDRLAFAAEAQTVRARFETDVGEVDLAEE